MTSDPLLGITIAQYEILSRLGGGGMGVVYAARDKKLGRHVALKCLPPEWSHDEAARQRFVREAQAASASDHRNICTIHDIIAAEDGRLFIVMPSYDGQTLKQRLQAGPVPVDEAIDIAAQVAEGLARAHERGVIHRDIKPGNLMLAEDAVKILDFGLAKLAGSQDLTAAGSTLGTVAYMSPEQTRGDDIGPESDIWAVGVVLYEMLSGRQPFKGGYPEAIGHAILRDTPVPLRDSDSTVPEALEQIVFRALHKQPAVRYKSARDLARALRHLQGRSTQIESGSTPVADPAPADTSDRSTIERHGLLVLPFANLGADPESDYFSDGLTEEIIADLSNVRRLRVISRTSSMQLKGTTLAVSDLARQLRIEYVLEGSVRRNRNDLRVTAKLVEAATDAVVWGQKYDGTLDDVFTMQESMSRSIVEALRVTLTAEEDRQLAQRPIADVRAYEWSLRARQEMLRFTPDGLSRALEYLKNSEAIVGENILILAAQGEAYWQYVNGGLSSDPAYLDKAEACARRILTLDPKSPHGHRVAGLARLHRGDVQGALRALKRSLDLAPNDPDSLMWASLFAGVSGKTELAERWAARLVEIDPVTPFVQAVPATVAWMRGDSDLALARLTAHPEAMREHHGRRLIYGLLLAAAGRFDEANVVLEEVAQREPGHAFGQLALAYRHAFSGDRDQVRAILTPAVTGALATDPQYCWLLARCFALVNDVDNGIEWVRAAVEHGFINHALLARKDPFLTNLHGDPRYQALMVDVEQRTRALEI